MLYLATLQALMVPRNVILSNHVESRTAGKLDRRAFLVGAGLALACSYARAQNIRGTRKIGVLRPGPIPENSDLQITGIPNALQEFGYTEHTLQIEFRFAEGRTERLPDLMRDLLSSGVELVVAVGAAAAAAARNATKTVPIVMFANVDPLLLGIVPSLARPQGNLTGVLIAPDGTLASKRLSLFKEMIPSARSFTVLSPPGEASFELQINELRDAAAEQQVSLRSVTVNNRDYVRAFDEIMSEKPDGLFVGSHQLFVTDRKAVIAKANGFGLPSTYEWPVHVRDGGLMSYGANLTERYRLVAVYIDRILKGTKPQELPIDRPAKFELAINLKTARSLGLSIDPGFLARADEVVE